MFTGLIEDLGRIDSINRRGNSFRLKVATSLPPTEIALGDSIAVNGVCLTVVMHNAGVFEADVSPETMQSSTFNALSVGGRVNLERALRLGDRLGGHLVSGHIDTVGTIVQRTQDDIAVRFSIELPRKFMRYVIGKGSIAIDGISLTVNQVTDTTFSVAVIPHSLAKTTLQHYGVGAKVNIETDMLGRYIEKLLSSDSDAAEQNAPATGTGLSWAKLAENGFF
ncbi:MAG: riboflavin synthase [Desulfuromonadaceae bacterium]|nr:riboflavin synthase [Desulfuromonas sp.]MDY0185807.1 riboflavin synthase [Desulfuromonadaceae bacterium]